MHKLSPPSALASTKMPSTSHRNSSSVFFDWMGPLGLVLLVSSGQLKQHPLFSWLPVDLTLIAIFFVLGLSVSKIVLIDRFSTKLPWILILPLLAFLFGLFGSSLESYSLTKVATFAFITIPGLIFSPVVLLDSPRRRKLLVHGLLAIGIFVLVSTLLDSQNLATTHRLIFESANTISTARMLGNALLICVALLLFKTRNRIFLITLALITMSSLLIAVILLTGSRGPFLSVPLTLVITTLLIKIGVKSRLKVIFALTVGFVLTVWAATATDHRGISRITDLLFEDHADTGSISARTSFLYSESLEAALDRPFGTGWGDLTEIEIFSDATGRRYSHNIFIEFLIEGGWLSALLIVVFIAIIVSSARKLPLNWVNVALVLLMIYSLINATVSGDINDNRVLWLTLSATLAAPRDNTSS